MELAEVDIKGVGFDWDLALLANQLGAAFAATAPGSTASVILTDPQFRAVFKVLKQRSGAELLAQPEITITSGRQGMMKSTTIKHLVTGINKQALTPPGITTTNGDESPLYVTKPVEFGQTLDVTPRVLDDRYTVALTVTPTVTDFLGYVENPTNRVAVYVNGKKKWVTLDRLHIRSRQMPASVRVRDGPTVFLRAPPTETVTPIKDPVPLLDDPLLASPAFRIESGTTNKQTLLIFVTPTIVGPEGNRVHAAEETPSPRDETPRQPAR